MDRVIASDCNPIAIAEFINAKMENLPEEVRRRIEENRAKVHNSQTVHVSSNKQFEFKLTEKQLEIVLHYNVTAITLQ